MGIGALFLFRRIKLVSSLGVEQAKAALEARLALDDRDCGPARNDREQYPFSGRITGDGFRILRRAPRRNNVRPLLQGVFRADASGTQVHVTARPSVTMAVPALGILGMSMCVALAGVFEAITEAEYSGLLLLIMPLFGSLVVYLPFGLEVGRAERFLRDTLKAERSPSA
jgi:hypothetical protein